MSCCGQSLHGDIARGAYRITVIFVHVCNDAILGRSRRSVRHDADLVSTRQWQEVMLCDVEFNAMDRAQLRCHDAPLLGNRAVVRDRNRIRIQVDWDVMYILRKKNPLI